MDRDFSEYLKTACSSPVLTREEEVSLFERVTGGDTSARDLLVTSNVAWVVEQARMLASKRVPLEDLVQAGTVGLMESLGMDATGSRWLYDPDKGRFLTFAAFRVYENMYEMIVNSSPIADAQVLSLDGPVPSQGFNRRSVLSLSMEVGSEGEDGDSRPTLLGDLVADERTAEEARVREDYMHVMHEVGKMPALWREVLSAYYGLGGCRPMGLDEVALVFGFTVQRAGKIVQQARDRVRSRVGRD